MAETQAQVAASQRQLLELQSAIRRIEDRIGPESDSSGDPSTSSSGTDRATLASTADDLRERQDVQQAEIATHEQAKVESESKYPVKLSGLVLLNAFTNTRAVDAIQVPVLAINGGGSSGATFRQTILGVDAKGPHIFGAVTRADVRVDFFGAATQSSYGASAGYLRLRTAHATLDWTQTQIFAALDRPLFNPNTPTSLASLAVPALSWSGNLWSWLPQAGLTHRVRLSERSQLKLQAALMDVPDPPIPGGTTTQSASFAEQSRWPGTEARVAWARGEEGRGAEIGFGGYFSPHHLGGSSGFNSWAATADYRIPLPGRLELTGSFYRGLGLGGLGAGAYKDYAFTLVGNHYYYRALDDVGGWTQLKARLGQRVQINGAFGMDNAFARQIRPYVDTNSNIYMSLARNQTTFTNVIYNPRVSTLFSLEYRHIASSPVIRSRQDTNVIGVAAGYQF